MVNRSLSQSAEDPSFFNCFTIRPPYSFFQSQAYFKNSSLVRSSLLIPSLLSLSMTFTSVAMAAWSVPGCHSAE